MQSLRFLQVKLNSFFSVSKQNSKMSNKLTEFHKNLKVCLLILKALLNNKKIPLTLPIYPQIYFVTNSKKG